jgi:hypothetical protein
MNAEPRVAASRAADTPDADRANEPLVPPAPPGRLRSTRSWARATTVGLAAAAALAAVNAAATIATAGAQWQAQASVAAPPGLPAMRLVDGSLGVGELVTYIATAVAFLVWLRRSVSNALDMGVATSGYTPGEAVFTWFIPIVNLVSPYRLITELHRDLATPSSGRSGAWLIRAWWAAWLAAAAIGAVGIVLAGSTATLGVPILYLGSAVGAIATFTAAVLAISMVREIQRLGDTRVTRQTVDTGQSGRVVVVALGFTMGIAVPLLAFLGFTVAGRPADPTWATFASTAGGFSVSFPRTPTESPTTVSTAAGTVVQHTFGSRLDAGATFAVFYVDFPTGSLSSVDPQTVLGRLGAVPSPNVLLSRDVVTRGLLPGVAERIRMSGGSIADVRYFLDGDRLYGLEVDSSASRAPTDEISRFFASFNVNP